MDATALMNNLIKSSSFDATIADSNFKFMQKANQNGLDIEKMAKENVEMKKSIAEVESLRKEVEELRKKVTIGDDIEQKAFEAMENDVKSDADVKIAKDKLAREKTKAINSLCMQYQGFADAYTEYKTAVLEAHQRLKSNE